MLDPSSPTSPRDHNKGLTLTLKSRKSSAPLLIPGTVKVSNPYVELDKERGSDRKRLKLKNKEDLLQAAREKLQSFTKTTKAKEIALKDPRMRYLLRQT